MMARYAERAEDVAMATSALRRELKGAQAERDDLQQRLVSLAVCGPITAAP
jgi:uncharacterized alpha-E superfamily protein